MSRNSFRLGLAALAVAGLVGPARAQVAPAYNPYAGLAQQPGFALQPGRGMNLAAYQQAISNPGFNPYTPVGPGMGSNPYTPGGDMTGAGGMTSPYFPFAGNGGIYGPSGGTLYGAGEFLRGYGTALTSQEQARIIREQARQARLTTIKSKFDLDMYIRANTPTLAEEQAKIARQTLKRIQSAANPTEVSTGRALNFLLDDMAKAPGKKVSMDPVPLSEEVLSHINVRTPNSGGSLGLLRNDGKLNWPVALTKALTAEQRKGLETQAQALVRDARKNKLDANLLRDFAAAIDHALDQVVSKANDIATPQYREAKRFLGDLDNARMAIEGNLLPVQEKFQKFAAGGKNIDEVVNYMVANGLVFGPATQADEAAYRALYSAIVAYNVAFNNAAPTAAPESKE